MIVRSTTTSGEYGFEIQGRKDDLRDVDAQSVTVSLKIGNDLGVQAIPCRSLSKGIDFCR